MTYQEPWETRLFFFNPGQTNAGIGEQQAKLADDWVISHMNAEKSKERKESLNAAENRIKALKADIDPAQIEELEKYQR